jgi:hypothetical protein
MAQADCWALAVKMGEKAKIKLKKATRILLWIRNTLSSYNRNEPISL